MNIECLAKLGWNFIKNVNTLWCKVFKGKYGRNNNDVDRLQVKPQDLGFWKALVHSWNAIDNKISGLLGMRRLFRLERPIRLKGHLNTNLNEHENDKVVDLVDSADNWDWNMLRRWCSQEWIAKIVAIHPPNKEVGKNECVRGGTNDGNFSLITMTLPIVGHNIGTVEWSTIWKLQVPERAKIFT